MSYLYVPGTEVSTWDSDSQFQVLGASCTWRGKPRASKSWSRACKTGSWIKRLSGRISAPSTASLGVESWIASLRESRASRGASPGSEPGSTTSGTSAKNSSASLARWDRATSSWRTSPGLFDSEPPIFSGDWPTSGSMRSGACSAARESEPLIDGSGSSCWPTATAGDSKASGSADYGTESGRHSGTTLTDAGRMWPTPDTGCHKGSSQIGQRRGQLDEAAEQKFASPPRAHLAPPGTGAGSPSGSTQPSLEKTEPNG